MLHPKSAMNQLKSVSGPYLPVKKQLTDLFDIITRPYIHNDFLYVTQFAWDIKVLYRRPGFRG